MELIGSCSEWRSGSSGGIYSLGNCSSESQEEMSHLFYTVQICCFTVNWSLTSELGRTSIPRLDVLIDTVQTPVPLCVTSTMRQHPSPGRFGFIFIQWEEVEACRPWYIQSLVDTDTQCMIMSALFLLHAALLISWTPLNLAQVETCRLFNLC